jgi:hypothetical protein
MPRKTIFDQVLVSDRWFSCDPLDNGIIERLYEAEEWFLKKESDQLFSFEYICAILGLPRLTYGAVALLEGSKAQDKFCWQRPCRSPEIGKKPRLHAVRSDFPRRHNFHAQTAT